MKAWIPLVASKSHNFKQGKLAEDIVAAELEARGCRVVRQISLFDPLTKRHARLDFVAHPAEEDRPTELTFIEVKSSSVGEPRGPNPNQLAVLEAIARGDAIPFGFRAVMAGLELGKPLSEQPRARLAGNVRCLP